MRIELPKLPYSVDALAPLISGETVEFHHGRHQLAYVEKANRLTVGTPFSKASLLEIVENADGALLDNAAQAWNHEFYWRSLSPPDSPRQASASFLAQVREDFRGLDGLKRDLRDCAMSVFGSGWAWLVKNPAGHLRIVSTHDADNPLRAGLTPLLTCDAWEHAYYIDYRNERSKYLDSYLKLVNWVHAGQCFDLQSDQVPDPSSTNVRSIAKSIFKQERRKTASR